MDQRGFIIRHFLGRRVGQPRAIIQVRPDINRGEITVDFELSEMAHGIVSIMPGQVIVK